VLRRISSISATIDSKSAVASGWKTIAATPFVTIPCPVASVTYAVERAKSRSGAGPLSFLRPPSRESRKPMCA